MNKWMKEQDHVRQVFPDAEVKEVTAQYEAFHAIVDGVRMIFYPHTTKGTGNQHLRVRNGTPQRKADFLRLAAILQRSKQPTCTFHVNNYWPSYDEVELKKDGSYPEYWANADRLKTTTI